MIASGMGFEWKQEVLIARKGKIHQVPERVMKISSLSSPHASKHT